MSDETKSNVEKPWHFKPGNKLGGRPKGSRSKLGEAFIADLYADWEQHGAAVIARVREERPQDYLKVTASILPKDLNVTVRNFDEMSDDELIARIRQLDDVLRPVLASTGEGGASGDRPSQATH